MSSHETPHRPYAGADATIVEAAEAAVMKAVQTPGRLLLAGIMSGIYIGIGFWLAVTTAAAYVPAKVVGFEAGRLVTETIATDPRQSALMKFLLGAVFPVGLIAVLIAGAELWTGCVQVIPYGVKLRKFGFKTLLYNWLVAYAGNWVGAVLLAFTATFGTSLLVLSPSFDLVLQLAYLKVTLDPWTAFWRGVGCNFLVNLAIWMWLRSRKQDFMGQALLIWFPIFTFVSIGFEHSIANMFLISAGLMAAAMGVKKAVITYWDFFFNNLLPVTLGNLVGGYVLIALVYWYLGFVKGGKYGEATPADALKYLIMVFAAGLILILLEVVAIGWVAAIVERALGIVKGAGIEPTSVLLPAVVAGILYIIIPFVAFKILDPVGEYREYLKYSSSAS